MIYRPLWDANRVLVFNNCLVLDFPKDQNDLTITIPVVKSNVKM